MLKPMSTLESYHAFLIKYRRYCERETQYQPCYNYATEVRNINGRDTVLCSEHAGRLDAVRQSDKKQER